MMKYLKMNSLILICSIFIGLANAQNNAKVLDKVPTTVKEVIETKSQFLATINWLENNLDKLDTSKGAKQKGYFMAWLEKTPDVTVEINAYVLEFSAKNPDLLLFYLSGWAKYSLTAKTKPTALDLNTKASKNVLKIYENGEFKNDTNLNKLLKIAKKGGLQKWVKSKLP